MQDYPNRSGSSGVRAFEIGPDFIIVRFADGGTYLYNHERPGWAKVERMKLLAKQGRGLATYINREAYDYAKKLG